ncbi:histidine phosphatase family protein, partial [Acinetobacter nosocomialis]
MVQSIALVADSNNHVTLFTRHSIREIVNGQGLAGYDLQLTESGRVLAEEWGACLIENTGRMIQHC